MKRERGILLCFFLVTVLSLRAQQPSYYRIGEKACAGLDLYSIAQDKKGDIWLSSDQGLLRYDGYQFHTYSSEKLKSKSLFGLKKDREGTLFCYNLVGQIFQISEDSLKLYAEIPDSLIINFFEFNFDNRNRLVFKTGHYYEIDKQRKITRLLEDQDKTVKNIPVTDREELVLADAAHDRLYYYKDGVMRQEQKAGFADLPKDVKLFFNLQSMQDRLFLHGQRTPYIYEERAGNWQLTELDAFPSSQTGWNTYILEDESIWLASERNGTRVFDKKGQPMYQGVTLLPRYRISCFLEDTEGNLWLPTLGKGIIVVPNKALIDFRNHPLLKEDDIQSVDVDRNGIVYLGGVSGAVYAIENDKVRLFRRGSGKISLLHYIENEHALIYGSEKVYLSDGTSDKAPLPFEKAKDAILIGPNQYLKATYFGVDFFHKDPTVAPSLGKYFQRHENSNRISAGNYTLDIGRTGSLAWDPIRKHIWAGTNLGLKLIKPDTTLVMSYGGRPVFATSLIHEQGKTWVATINRGVLVYKEDELIQSINTDNGLLSEGVRKIILKGEALYLISEAGLQVFDLTNQSFRNFTLMDGLLSEFILDFAIVGQTAWLIFQNGVQKIPIDRPIKSATAWQLEMHEVQVNGKKVDPNQPGRFPYDQNELAFEFMLKGHQHRGKLTYQYQLEGWKDEWLEKKFLNNHVEYKSLPVGTYRFVVRAVGPNQSASPTLTYAFSIQSPFWMTRWFYLLCTLAIAGIIIGIFKFREFLITEKLQLENKLKNSEVTALKAQMNPHFIFNTLNSIQDLILMEDIRASNLYLGKFADLMRILLNASGQNQIPLNQEIRLLDLYLEMEKLRFGDDFSSTIQLNVPPATLAEIEVPSLLIQPYVENAIKHGLLHKKGRKEIVIAFFMQSKALHCLIKDNGVGRKKSAQIKARRHKKHLSFSTTANQKRIDLLNEASQNKIRVSIEDLHPDQEESGTIVHLVFTLT